MEREASSESKIKCPISTIETPTRQFTFAKSKFVHNENYCSKIRNASPYFVTVLLDMTQIQGLT